mgnify:CR=1 FL=1
MNASKNNAQLEPVFIRRIDAFLEYDLRTAFHQSEKAEASDQKIDITKLDG